MLISHETPVSMLNISRYYNDYDYCLVHLLPEIEQYKDFYFKSIEKKRHVLLDNSIFELGEAYDSDKFAQWVLDLKPTEYIIPDVLEDTSGTINSFESFKLKYNKLPGKTIGVVQGKTYKELVECYKFLASKVDKIAISFDYSYYLDNNALIKDFYLPDYIKLHDNFNIKWNQYAAGRLQFLLNLKNDNVLVNKPHHLLGCSVPWEFSQLSHVLGDKINLIETIDTSNPIVAGIRNQKYNESYGLMDKWSCKLIDYIMHEPSLEEQDLIQDNIRLFKNFCRK